MGGCVITHPSSMIRKSVLIENNIRYEEVFSPAEDYALWCRLIPFTKFHNIDEVLFHYRDHAENTSHKQEDKMWQKTLEIWSLFRAKEDILYNTFLLKTTQKIDIRLFGLIPIISITKYKNRMKIYFMGILLLKFRTRLVYQER